MFFSGLSVLIPAFINRVFFDRVIPEHFSGIIPALIAVYSAASTAGALSGYYAELFLTETGREYRNNSRIRIVEHIWKLKPGWFDNYGAGAVLKHFEDSGKLGNLKILFFRTVVKPVLILTILIPFLVYLQPMLLVIRIGSILPAFAAGTYFIEKDLILEKKLWETRKELSDILYRGSSGALTLILSADTSGYTRRLRSVINRLGLLEEKRQKLGYKWDAGTSIISSAGQILSLTAAVYFVLEGKLTFGSYIAFSIIVSRATAESAELLNGIKEFARTSNAFIRNNKLKNTETENSIKLSFLGSPLKIPGELVISNLDFSYNRIGKVLKNLNLRVSAKEKVLIRGKSGEGKSTLFSLIMGNLKPQSGYIKYAGILLSESSRSQRNFLVGSILQHPAFFEGTVKENLCLFGQTPSDSYIWEILKIAAADRIVRELPGKLEHKLSGEESTLSGGQKQRLAIARLLIHPPPLILLDESINALDNRTSQQISKALSTACKDKTVLVVTHGKNSPIPIDREVLLENGCIYE